MTTTNTPRMSAAIRLRRVTAPRRGGEGSQGMARTGRTATGRWLRHRRAVRSAPPPGPPVAAGCAAGKGAAGARPRHAPAAGAGRTLDTVPSPARAFVQRPVDLGWARAPRGVGVSGGTRSRPMSRAVPGGISPGGPATDLAAGHLQGPMATTAQRTTSLLWWGNRSTPRRSTPPPVLRRVVGRFAGGVRFAPPGA